MPGSLTTNQSNAVAKTSSTNAAEQLGATAPILQGLMEGQGLHNPAPATEARNQQAALTAGQLVRAREIYHAAPTLANRDLLIATLGKELTTQRGQLKEAQAQLEKYQAEKEREVQIQQGRQGWGEWAINSLKNFFGSATDPQLEKYQRVVTDAQKEIAELEAEQNNLTGTLAKNWIDNLPIFETQVIAPQNAEAIAALPQPHSRQLLQSNTTSPPEFRVNTYTAGSQELPSVAALSTGDFVVAWQSFGQDGSSDGVYAQRYNATGVAQGGEFRVNTYTAGDQGGSSVAALSTGDFVVAWTSYGQDSSYNGVYAQRYNASGIAQGGEFQVNTHTVFDQYDPSVAALSTGDFVVAWTSFGQDNFGEGVYAQRYSATGTAQGSEFRVNTYTVFDQWYPSVAALSTGDFVVAWNSDGQDGSDYGVYAQRYSSTGIAQGSEFRVNTYTVSSQDSPSVAALSTGDFVVAWTNLWQDGPDWGVYAQRYSSTGIAQGSEFQVNTYTGYQWYPSVAALSTGDFVVAWQSLWQDGPDWEVYARRYNATGVAQGSEFRVNTYTAGDQVSPSVAALSTGDFVVAWQSYGQDGSSNGVYARICSEDNCRIPESKPRKLDIALIAGLASGGAGLAALCLFYMLYRYKKVQRAHPHVAPQPNHLELPQLFPMAKGEGEPDAELLPHAFTMPFQDPQLKSIDSDNMLASVSEVTVDSLLLADSKQETFLRAWKANGQEGEQEMHLDPEQEPGSITVLEPGQWSAISEASTNAHSSSQIIRNLSILTESKHAIAREENSSSSHAVNTHPEGWPSNSRQPSLTEAVAKSLSQLFATVPNNVTLQPAVAEITGIVEPGAQGELSGHPH